jgi:acid phosphatase
MTAMSFRHFMLIVIPLCLLNGVLHSGVHVAAGRSFSPKSTFITSKTKTNLFDTLLHSLSQSLATLGDGPKSCRVLQVQIVHRHGDRTPITPLQNETFWASTLPGTELLAKLDSQTRIIRDRPNAHKAGGRGPFGKLTQLGLLQMVELGTKLREELHWEQGGNAVDPHGNVYLHHGRLFHPDFTMEPNHVDVISTDFPRTIQSVQGVLVGLFPEFDGVFEIDVRFTSDLIPDPQPRRSAEQEELELKLASRPHLLQREDEMRDLAIKTTAALMPLLGEGALDVSFGVGEEGSSHHHHHLAWTQLSEITKCLAVRDMLPPSISIKDQQAISAHAAWKWMEHLRHPRLAYLAMNPMLTRMLQVMKDHAKMPPLTLYSAHDSTLIGLLCALNLESPSQWPGYGEYLKVELLECGRVNESGEFVDTEHYVRFSLSGNVLKSHWGSEPVELIRLNDLENRIASASSHSNKEHSGF